MEGRTFTQSQYEGSLWSCSNVKKSVRQVSSQRVELGAGNVTPGTVATGGISAETSDCSIIWSSKRKHNMPPHRWRVCPETSVVKSDPEKNKVSTVFLAKLSTVAS